LELTKLASDSHEMHAGSIQPQTGHNKPPQLRWIAISELSLP